MSAGVVENRSGLSGAKLELFRHMEKNFQIQTRAADSLNPIPYTLHKTCTCE